jgi:nucleolar GTP-binding protein
MNVLYDKDHYKLALGQINTARHLIDQVAKDYVRLLKFGDSLYRCKQLKKAALGRMATVMKRQKDSLAYLEQVRQHLSRLPSIDPNTRTLLICGYPNVGKSSFINKITRAEVDVQPYAFTTKSLFVGHMDYKYMRWQVIDTPGILDHPLEERNTIEMQSITAMAHLRSCIMYFMDLSEQCGYSVEDQVKLFNNIKPLFANKPIVLVINKIDQAKPEDLPAEQKKWIEDIANDENATVLTMSCYNDDGVMNVRNSACDKLLQARVEMKMKGNKINDVINKIHLAQPQQRDNIARLPNVPAEVSTRVKYDRNDPNRRRLEKDNEIENGGAGVFNVDIKSEFYIYYCICISFILTMSTLIEKYLLADDDWKYDVIPEFLDGHNVADFIDPDIEEKLEALEREEERLEQEGFYNSDEEILDDEEEAMRTAADAIRDRKKVIIQQHRAAHGRTRPKLIKPVAAKYSSVSDMELQLEEMGVDSSEAAQRIRDTAAGRKRTRTEAIPDEAVRDAGAAERGEVLAEEMSQLGFRNVKQKKEADKQKKLVQKQSAKLGKRGEADRAIQTKMPKHLFSSKTSMGTRDWR